MAVLSVGAVVLVRETTLSQRVLDGTPLLLAAIGLTTWFGGIGPGLVSLLLAALAVDYYFIRPIDSWELTQKDIPSLAMFLVSGLFFVWVSAARRWAEHALSEARDEMEAKVVARTADLARANDQLRGEIAERKRTDKALEEVAGRLINAQEDERSRIGRELHDHVSQRLGLLAIKIDQLRMHASTPTTISPALDDLRQQTSEITDDIHSLSHRLHSSMLDHLGIIPALQRLVKECSERHAIPITFTHAPLADVPSDVALCLFRVAEESLTNMAKHSHAASARVDITAADEGVRLCVADEGAGFDVDAPDSKAGLGLVSMRERLRLVQGSIRIHSAPSQGTRIDVWVPLPRGET
jgi:signal transduction histidine kinase